MKKYLFLLLIALLLFQSCRRQSTTAVVCQIIQMDDSFKLAESYHYYFTYNDLGQLITLTKKTILNGHLSNSMTENFFYNSNLIFINGRDFSNAFNDTVTLNSYGLIESVISNDSSLFTTNTQLEKFFYNNSGEVSQYVLYTQGILNDTTNYNWQNNDMLSAYTLIPGGTIAITDSFSASNIAIKKGDYSLMKQILQYGAYYYKNSHQTDFVYNQKIGYSYDSYGNISFMQMNSNEAIAYQYLCR